MGNHEMDRNLLKWAGIKGEIREWKGVLNNLTSTDIYMVYVPAENPKEGDYDVYHLPTESLDTCRKILFPKTRQKYKIELSTSNIEDDWCCELITYDQTSCQENPMGFDSNPARAFCLALEKANR